MDAGPKKRKQRVLPRQEKPPVCAKMGLAMRRERKRRKWSQEDLAEGSGLRQGETSAIENKRCFPGLETAERVARGFRFKLSRWIARVERTRSTGGGGERSRREAAPPWPGGPGDGCFFFHPLARRHPKQKMSAASSLTWQHPKRPFPRYSTFLRG